MSKRRILVIFLFCIIEVHLSYFVTTLSIAASSTTFVPTTVYCKIGILKNHEVDSSIIIDFIFTVDNEQRIQDVKNLIFKIGADKFLQDYLNNDKIFFYDRDGVIREIYDVQFNKNDLDADSVGLFVTGKIKNFDEFLRTQPERYSAYLGCNIITNLISDITYLSDAKEYLKKDQKLLQNYSIAKSKTALELINKYFSKSDFRLIETNLKNDGWLIDLDDNGTKEVVITPKLHLGYLEPKTSCASLIIIYQDGHYKSQIDFGQKNNHLYYAQIIGAIDYNKNGKKELVIRCTYYESSYYIIIDDEKKDNNIIFYSQFRY